MKTISVIHAGDTGEELRRLVNTLDSVGIPEVHFMSDFIAVLRTKRDFELELNILLDELIYGEYYHHQLSHGNIPEFKEYTSRFMDDVAIACSRLAKQFHGTLVDKGLYDNDGKFPHEFHSFNGRAISVRSI